MLIGSGALALALAVVGGGWYFYANHSTTQAPGSVETMAPVIAPVSKPVAPLVEAPPPVPGPAAVETAPAVDVLPPPVIESPAAKETAPARVVSKPRKVVAPPPAPSAPAPAVVAPAPAPPPVPPPPRAAPQSACAGRNFIAMAQCMAAQCVKAEFKTHPQCEAVRKQQRLEEEIRNPSLLN